MATIYLLHFESKLHHAQHYMGFAEAGIDKRLKNHRSGRGARLMAVVREAGIPWRLARIWSGPDITRTAERQLKKYKNAGALCPVCCGSVAFTRKADPLAYTPRPS